ncbi:roadblock/LC7 domain-containing protein [Nocardia brasiliensis]|uniref:roadblock/LC7 domain-containing protein n=1 Tax=Nocardia brasiliensis TaxID=37326 RepID=UPI00245697B5|nr:roadblock/LC7 domain-containing protein [Nocardia brasiliensis]
MTTSVPSQLSWLLEQLLARTPRTRHALLLSGDGLKICHTPELGMDKADQLAAIAAGIQSLSHGASVEFGDGRGGVRQSMTEFYGGILFIVEAGLAAHIAVVAAEDADAGLVGHNMRELVEQLGHHLASAPRNPGGRQDGEAEPGWANPGGRQGGEADPGWVNTGASVS